MTPQMSAGRSKSVAPRQDWLGPLNSTVIENEGPTVDTRLPSWLGSVDAPEAAAWLATQEGLAPLTSNQDYEDIPFQRWYRFKEAFSPRFVADALMSLPMRPHTCTDPFGGSGTTALTCQFLGVRPTTIEVNPFLADLIEAKLTVHNADGLIRARKAVAASLGPAKRGKEEVFAELFPGAPSTFVEPGKNGRWVFDLAIAQRIAEFVRAIEAVTDEAARRLLRVVLASVLVPMSNVVISGKGRRYRSAGRRHLATVEDLDRAFESSFQRFLFDAYRYRRRACGDFKLLRGDARTALSAAEPADLILFSPPYPNSFDYTDIYNVELWVLGYLRNGADNRRLREATLRSHVQIKREFASSVVSPTLSQAVDGLRRQTSDLWNPHLPAMIGAYFDDLSTILVQSRDRLTQDGRIMLVVGDSRYAGVRIDVPQILLELLACCGLKCESTRAVRSMRASAQQGGDLELSESLLVLLPS